MKILQRRLSLKEKIGKVRLLALDVDGVLTDGRIIWTGKGEEVRHFHVQDGT
ncbi:MAG: 3-deoxy-D-manno-octulosonate 8-phosphate phosphatase, partial [Planctomycetota bacterium]